MLLTADADTQAAIRAINDIHLDHYLLEPSLPAVVAAGDVRHQSIKRVASAVGDGSYVLASGAVQREVGLEGGDGGGGAHERPELPCGRTCSTTPSRRRRAAG